MHWTVGLVGLVPNFNLLINWRMQYSNIYNIQYIHVYAIYVMYAMYATVFFFSIHYPKQERIGGEHSQSIARA